MWQSLKYRVALWLLDSPAPASLAPPGIAQVLRQTADKLDPPVASPEGAGGTGPFHPK